MFKPGSVLDDGVCVCFFGRVGQQPLVNGWSYFRDLISFSSDRSPVDSAR